MSREHVDRGILAQAEVTNASFGDERLTKRLGLLARALAMRPGETLPEALGDEAALEGAYRFFGNERVSPEGVLAPHVEQSCHRCNERGRVLVLFDTTEIRLGGEREQLGYLTSEISGRGLLAHVGLAVDAATREPLGVVHCETIVRLGSKEMRQQTRRPEDKESLRWNRSVATVHTLLPAAICVTDREGDIFTMIADMHGRGQDFIIRAAQNRTTPEGALWDLADSAPLVALRQVELALRKPNTRKSKRKLHPSRSAHQTKLEVRARPVTLQTPKKKEGSSRNAQLIQLNLVCVVEPEPPAGDKAVEWRLLTTLPIETKRDVDFIVDAYRARWVIEEYFKALKSGCAIEKRQLESVHSMTNALAVSLPIAWLLLRLRHLSRDQPERPATNVLPPLAMTCLRVLHLEGTRKKLPPRPTCHELTWAIAALGGHIKNNGEPGLIVLGRGLTRLLEAAEVVAALKEAGEL